VQVDEGRLLELIGDDAPITGRRHGGGPRVFVFPYWPENPFVNATYVAFRSDGGDVVPLTSLEALAEASRRIGRGDVLHIHWTSIIAQAAPDARSAARRFRVYRRALRRVRRRGGRVIWTAHNAIAHDAGYRDVEIRTNALTAATADTIHILSEHTGAAMRRHYPVDATRFHLQHHPGYGGLIPPLADRKAARARFGVEGDRLAVLFFGQMRQYKGVDVLLSALERAAERRTDMTALLAGRTAPADLAALEPRIPGTLPVVRHHEFVSDADVPWWFAAADVIVLPYRTILNSGTVMLAASYGVPCILPDEPHLVAEYGGESWVRFFDRADPEASLADLLAEFRADGSSSAAVAFAEARDPFAYSRAIADLLGGSSPSRPTRVATD
jgi:beta-1,4-mannosyltransferase